MNNKKMLAVVIASTLGLSACDTDDTTLIDSTISDSVNRQSSVAFDLIAADKAVPTPSFLLMDTTDGTLNIPVDGTEAEQKDRSNPAVAMGDTDGWSPTQPFIIGLNLPEGVLLDQDPALLHAAVKLAKVDVNNYVMSAPQPLTAGVDFTVISDGKSLTVLPLNGSLDHNSNYIYAITDTLLDSTGAKLGMSSNYSILKNTQLDQHGTPFETPQKIVWQVEGIMAATGQASYDEIIYASWFTTSSAGESLFAVKVATAQAVAKIQEGALTQDPTINANHIWQGSANPNNLDLTGLYTLQHNVTRESMPMQAGVTVETGTILLPSFLERDLTSNKWATTPWQSAMPSLAIISSVLNSGSDAEKQELIGQLIGAGFTIDLSTPESLAESLAASLNDPIQQLKLIGQSFTIAGEPLDSERLITKYSPLPQVKAIEAVEYLLITPDTASPTPGDKAPIVIYQHGITSVKENILAGGELHTILESGNAVLAIDLPLHGERAISLPDGGNIIADNSNADVFMNFGYLAVGRDNMRQAAADLIGLRAGITMVGAAQLAASQQEPFVLGNQFDLINTQKVSFFGHSLGAMTGINYMATIDKPLPTTDPESSDPAVNPNLLFKMENAAFANPGGGVPYLLLNSATFGGTVKHGLMSAANENYAAYAGAYCDDDLNACFNNFYNGPGAGAQASINATFQSFAVAAQTVLETADPFALARNISVDTPVYLAQVADDLVIPNKLIQPQNQAGDNVRTAAPYSPIGGTEPLIAQLGLDHVHADNTTSKKAALLNAGDHSSVIVYNPIDSDRADAAITAELQSHIANFLSGDGTDIGAVDPDLLHD